MSNYIYAYTGKFQTTLPDEYVHINLQISSTEATLQVDSYQTNLEWLDRPDDSIESGSIELPITGADESESTDESDDTEVSSVDEATTASEETEDDDSEDIPEVLEVHGDPFVFKLEDLKRDNSWKDCCQWTVAMAVRGSSLYQPYVIFNQTALSAPFRFVSWPTLRVVFHHQGLINIMVPYSAGTFDDCIFKVALPDKRSTLTSNKTFVEVPVATLLSNIDQVSPSLSIDGPDTLAADSIGTYTLTATHSGHELSYPIHVYLEAYSGYLPIRDLHIQNDPISFKVYSLGLQPGDTIRVKVNTKFRYSLTEKIIHIV